MVSDQLNIDSYSGILEDTGSNLTEYTVQGLVKTQVLLKKKKHMCFGFYCVFFFRFYWAFLAFIKFLIYCVMFHNIT